MNGNVAKSSKRRQTEQEFMFSVGLKVTSAAFMI